MRLEDDFCDIINKARLGQHLSLADVCQRTGIAEHELHQLEKGTRIPTPAEVQALARALGLRPGPLMEIAFQRWAPQAPPNWIEQQSVILTMLGEIGGYAVKGYVLYDASTRDALMIDTAYHPEQMCTALRERALRLNAICLTHGHTDHAGGLDRILSEWPVPVYLGPEDRALLPWQPPSDLLKDLHNDHRLTVGSLSVRCLATPGHTPGGFCFYVEHDDHRLCCVGDTVFAGSIGRSNPFSLYPIHLDSLRKIVLELPWDTVLLPGHGPATTVEEERMHNPFAC